MDKKYIDKFVEAHKNLEVSPAKVEYTCLRMPVAEQLAVAYLDRSGTPEEEEKIGQIITTEEDGAKLVDLMRKPMSGGNRSVLRQKLVEKQAETVAIIKEKATKAKQDSFIEDATYVLLRCDEDPCEWITSEYDNLSCDYMKSMMCLVLGVRGNKDMIPFLIGEAERLESTYANEMFEQGPVIAVQHLLDLLK
ncbi:MAG: hypothetical protein PUB09_05070 [Firmicutes bacterium]|nr:hypothetical protein [Bacillota bacterium]